MAATAMLIGTMSMAIWGAGADRPAGNAKGTRSAVLAPHGIVATSQPLAAQAGLDILKKGGNAIDAAIAANAVLGVVEPMSCGIGGDLFAIVWDAKSKRLHGLNASGRSPFAASPELFRKKGLEEIPETGPLAWSVPGCVAGWFELHEKFGKLPMDVILAPAIDYAENGFGVTEIIGLGWYASAGLLRQTPESARTYLIAGRPPRVGDRMTNRYLARTYRMLADEGPDAFYKGAIAEKIVAYSERVGGLFTARDFAEHHSSWVEPVGTSYRGYQVWELPPNGQGIAVLQMLNILEPFDIAGMGHNSPVFLHLFVEAKKLAFEDRARFYADPQVEKVPVEVLIGKEYATQRRQHLNLDRASDALPAGEPKLVHGDTVYLTAVDADRNVVSMIQSIYFGWGSGLVPDDLGFMLQNRGNLFALEEGHLNQLKPHKRPFHTIIPGMVTKDGRPWLSFGVMGGDMQPQGHVQVLCNIIDHGMNVQEAGEAARVRHVGSSTPTGRIMRDGGEVVAETGISDAALQALAAKGHTIGRGGDYGGYQAILIDPATGILHGGSDPRKDGCAVGY